VEYFAIQNSSISSLNKELLQTQPINSSQLVVFLAFPLKKVSFSGRRDAIAKSASENGHIVLRVRFTEVRRAGKRRIYFALIVNGTALRKSAPISDVFRLHTHRERRLDMKMQEKAELTLNQAVL